MEETAVAQVYRQYALAVWRRCVRILRDEQLALDVTQEVFIRFLRHQSRLRPGRELLAWLYRVATNLCLNQIRDDRARALLLDALIGDEAAGEPAAFARQVTMRVLRGLDGRTQELAVYVLVDGMTHAEAAEVAGVSERTVRNCLGRFLAHGRAELEIRIREEKTS